MTELLDTILRRVGRDGDGRLHEAPPLLDLPDETFHVVYVEEDALSDEDEGQVRFARLTRESSSTYREEYSVALPRWLAKYLSFEAKPEVDRR